MAQSTTKRGRPPKSAEDKRTEVLYLKLTPAEKKLVTEVFSEPSVTARMLILRAARRVRR